MVPRGNWQCQFNWHLLALLLELQVEVTYFAFHLSRGHNARMFRCYRCEYGDCIAGAPMSECISKFCFTSTGLEVNNGQEVLAYKRGCDSSGLSCHLARLSNADKIQSRVQIECCSTDLCNNGTFPQLPSQSSKADLSSANGTLPQHSLPIFFGVFLFIAICFFIFVYLYNKKCSSKKPDHASKRFSGDNIENPEENEFLNSDYKPEIKVTAPGDSTIREAMIDGSVTSGSGSGFPLLVQRTLAKQINLKDCIGQGRYGEVWKGIFHSDEVAVKIFYSRDEASWQREVEIYSTITMKNENILPFIGSDVTSVNSCTQLWLVTTYYELGSLFDYLSVHPLYLPDMLSIMNSMASGISHVHTEVVGIQPKPAIAHRDIKSKNILMKSPATCCIADFGLAVTQIQTTGSLNIAMNYRVGTKRYMAPEVLNETMKIDTFDAYRHADIYSLALVFWEVYNRLKINGKANDYSVPYQNSVPSDPSFEDMRHEVCFKQSRPEMTLPPDEGKVSPLLASIRMLIAECWKEKPSSRLTSLHIKKKILSLMKQWKREQGICDST